MMRLLGIDAGGTHTDAVLLSEDAEGWQLTAAAKVSTCHEDLPASITQVLDLLAREAEAAGCPDALREVERVSLGTTLAVNALVQGRADRVGLALSAGPGLAPERFALGEDVCIVPGGLDHRGVEVSPLDCTPLAEAAADWQKRGVAAVACVSKFSPRNPAHERAMAEAVGSTRLPVTMGHSLSGQLNFPRRIATAYFNAAVSRVQCLFLDAAAEALAAAGVTVAPRLLKADGGAAPFALARQEPVQSILSGPAASVMGIMALCPEVSEGCSLLLDMGGTTSDLAIFVDGSPVMEREGMLLQGRRTLVRALACVSIGVGGDSCLHVTGHGASASVSTGPERLGPALAFGGESPTLRDALNVLDSADSALAAGVPRGDVAASWTGLAVWPGNTALRRKSWPGRRWRMLWPGFPWLCVIL
ncbi:MAG: hydantoinase/oxoprolinase family protein [Desulfovibrionaceae bacterium]|nr:hydantoinase/oxoprolinase family protein [Desulfovibrionaceae bacterium]